MKSASFQVWRSLADVPKELGPCVVTIGNFDGVHCGHRAVVAHVRERAKALGARAIAVTLWPHPSRVLRPERGLQMITPLPRKLELLAETGLDGVLVLPFTPEYARTTARDFAQTVLCDTMHSVEVHEGEDFRFGREAEADIKGLAALGNELGFCVEADSAKYLRGAIISSSRIRTLLVEGNVSRARALLGRSFDIDSTPVRDRGYGTLYTVPTINLAPYDELLPAKGVYVTTLRVGNTKLFRGVTNIGDRPTFGTGFAVETHLLDFEPLTLDAETPLRLTFYLRLREEKKWPTPEALRAQIGKDVQRAQRWFALTDVLTGALSVRSDQASTA